MCPTHPDGESQHLIIDVAVSEANGIAERQEALGMLARNAKRGSTVGADKGYFTHDFVRGCRELGVTPHVASKKSGSAIDGRTTRHAGYQISQRIRKRIEEGFGWLKTVGGLRKTKLIGRINLAGQTLLAFATYNLVRMASLTRPNCAVISVAVPSAWLCRGPLRDAASNHDLFHSRAPPTSGRRTDRLRRGML